MRFLTFALLIGTLTLSACQSGSESTMPSEIASAADVITAMQAQYADDWYETLTFEQETIQYTPDGRSDTSTWYEAMQLPGNLRIDVAPIEDGNGLLFASDSQYVFQGGQQVASVPRIHPLMLLGFDVYHQDPSETLAQIDSLGIDTSVMHETTWNDRPVYVVGAEEGDRQAPQFWIDQENLYFVRMLLPIGPTGANIQEIQFNQYEPMGQGWIAPEVLIYVDSTLFMEERYQNVRANVELPEGLFDPSDWAVEQPYWE